MRFYEIRDSKGNIVDVVTSLRKAKKIRKGLGENAGDICWMDILVNNESIRIILKKAGGFATKIGLVP